MVDTTNVVFNWHTIWLAVTRYVPIFRMRHRFGRQFLRSTKFHLCVDSGSNLHDTHYYNNHHHKMFVCSRGKCAWP